MRRRTRASTTRSGPARAGAPTDRKVSAMTPSAEADFSGTERFEIRRRLGAGGFGVVYEAFDRERNSLIALKTLHPERKGDALYRLKQEFRALADLFHPNLVKLYEMLAHEDRWFITMELVDGENFLSWVHSPARPEAVESLLTTVSKSAAAPDSPKRLANGDPQLAQSVLFDEVRLRDALRQAVL